VLAKVSQVPVGNALSATMDGEPVLISQPTAGTIVTFSAICTHQGCTVAPAGKQFHCPCHGSVYDAATGAVIDGPAPAPLKKIATHVADGEVIAGA
jgi:Rieske Fe-S protein